MDGYVRVSRVMGREGPGYISPTVQREAIEQWATRHAIELATVHVDEDETGGSHDRPGLNAAMARVRAGETGGIVAWKIDRFSRMTEHGLRDLRELHDRGARLAFVVEDLDLHGPVGRMLYTVLLAQHEFFLDQIKASWRTAKGRAMDRGAPPGPTPFGYARGDAGVLLVDPATAVIVREAFDAAAAKGGLHAALDLLVDRCAGLADRQPGTLRGGGVSRTWTTSTVRRMLRQRCYLGEFRYGELVHTDLALALVRPDVWHAAQPADPQRRRPAEHYPLSGLAVCGTCGTHMVGARSGQARDGSGLRRYRCAASLTTSKAKLCTAAATMVADRLEPYVREQAAIAAEDLAGRLSGDTHSVELQAADERLQAADWEVEQALVDLTLRRRLGDRYHAYLQVRLDEQDDARTAYEPLARRLAGSQVTADLPALIREATLEELGVLLRGILASIVVQRGRGPVTGRVRLVGHPLPSD